MPSITSLISRRALPVALVLIVLYIVLFSSFGEDASTVAQRSRSKLSHLLADGAKQRLQDQPPPGNISPSNAVDPCKDDPIPIESEPRSSPGTLVLITGGSGFIGSNLADRLVSLGYRVRILDNLYTGFIRNVPLHQKNIEFIHGDIMDPATLQKAVKDVEYVFHLAAMSKVVPSLHDPDMARFCTENNALGSWNVLNATRAQKGVKKVIYAGSSTYYGNQPIPHNEDAAPDFLSPYAASKYEGEIQMQMFDRLFDVPTITNRFFMVYGPRQPTTGAYAIVTGVFARQFAQGQPLTIEGDGTHFRDFIHVNDIVSGLIVSQQNEMLRGGIPINLGSGDTFSVKDVADMVSPNQTHVAERKNDLVGTLADTCRMKQLLKYRAKSDFNIEMAKMVEQTKKGNVFAQEWLTPLLALSVPYVLPSGSPVLPWAETHNDLDSLLERVEFVKDSISSVSTSTDNQLISVIPFGNEEGELEEQALLLANTVYSLVRFGEVRRYIVATLSKQHLEICKEYNMPCFDASSMGISSLVDKLLNTERSRRRHFDVVHLASLGAVAVDAIHTAAVDGADVTYLKPNGGLLIRSIPQSSEGSHKKVELFSKGHAHDDISSILNKLTMDKSLSIKSAHMDSLCTATANGTSSDQYLCPTTPIVSLSCKYEPGSGYPGGMAGKIWSLQNAGLWQLSSCTNGKFCDKQQYVPKKWVQSPPDLTGFGKFCSK